MRRPDPEPPSEPPGRPRPGGLARALGLTVASALVWGVAHLGSGRRVAGLFLLGVFAVLAGGVTVLLRGFRGDLGRIALQPAWLGRIGAGLLLLAALWTAVIVRSYLVARPSRLPAGGRAVAGALVGLLVMGVWGPTLWVVRDTYTLKDALNGIFGPGRGDPWGHRRRVNVLLLGGDGGRDRTGVRTDSVTLASVDTRTGDTVLIGLPRNLQRFPMPPALRSRWPDGFTGYPGDEGLLNELYQDAEDHPDLEPGLPPGRRGPRLVSDVVSEILGQPIDYYVLINLSGFAEIIDAVGGVRVHIATALPIGGDDHGRPPTGWLPPGDRVLNGRDALWYARSRHADSDYARMGRQKCLLRALAERADAPTVLAHLPRIAAAAKKTISTDLPADLLPALVTLAGRARHRIRSLLLVPPLIGPTPYRPDIARIRRLTAEAIGGTARTARPPAGRHDGGRVRDGGSPPGSPAPYRRSTAEPLDRLCGV